MEQAGKPFNQKMFSLGIGGTITGILIVVAGLGMMMLRVKLAVVFLGARALFDMPFAQEDATKVGMVVLLAIAIFLTGIALFLFGTAMSLIQFSRKKNA